MNVTRLSGNSVFCNIGESDIREADVVFMRRNDMCYSLQTNSVHTLIFKAMRGISWQ